MCVTASAREGAGAISRSASSRRSSCSARCCCTVRSPSAARRSIGSAGRSSPGWRARWRNRAKFRKTFRKELEELETYARDLRATILRLRRRPLRHCKTWIHVVSARFAVVGSLACYSLALAALLVFCQYAEPPLWTLGMSIRSDTFLLWQALEGRLLLLNWMAASSCRRRDPGVLRGAALGMLQAA